MTFQVVVTGIHSICSDILVQYFYVHCYCLAPRCCFWSHVSVFVSVLVKLVDETGERYRLNHAIAVQAACQAVVCETMCLQAACFQNTPHLTS